MRQAYRLFSRGQHKRRRVTLLAGGQRNGQVAAAGPDAWAIRSGNQAQTRCRARQRQASGPGRSPQGLRLAKDSKVARLAHTKLTFGRSVSWRSHGLLYGPRLPGGNLLFERLQGCSSKAAPQAQAEQSLAGIFSTPSPTPSIGGAQHSVVPGLVVFSGCLNSADSAASRMPDLPMLLVRRASEGTEAQPETED